MNILSMTATFGKLEHQTLELQPGLNIIEAPNEWGKSTWCDFLLAMLYGIDTRERSTKTTLAQKERYEPWSGSPMSGSVRLYWEGRDITIERTTKGRIPMGQFRAFETQSGLDVPELTADNCGQQLFGVEKSVFIRSGFIKFAGLPVSSDPELSRRLNALVTTGDDSGTADVMSGKLRELKNRIRSNRSNGLIPVALAQKEQLEASLAELGQLSDGIARCKEREAALEQQRRDLLLHRQHLEYAAAGENAQRVADSRLAAQQAQQEVETWEQRCRDLPDADTARRELRTLQGLQQESLSLQLEQQMLPPVPELPQETGPFAGLTAQQIGDVLSSETAAYHQLSKSNPWILFLGLAAILAGLATGIFLSPIGYCLAAVGLACIVMRLLLGRASKKALAKLEERYGSADTQDWKKMADEHLARRELVDQARQTAQLSHEAYRRRQKALSDKLPSEGLQAAMDTRQDVLGAWEALADARKTARQAVSHAEALAAMQAMPEKPQGEDTLTFTQAETARLLSDNTQQTEELHRLLGRYQGRMEALGEAAPLEEKLSEVTERLTRLEQTYAAVELAQETLEEAQHQLRSRFAPRIVQGAKERMALLTGGRYDRLSLTAELSVNAAARDENVQREGFRRSDGTLDQLYLSLRLAVAEALMAGGPLILDDALVRFDDTRLKAALALLQQEAQTRQILLFTCQTREKSLLPGL